MRTGLLEKPQRQPLSVLLILMFSLYLGLALITMFVFETITVWPSTGVALAAFLFCGWRIWPAIFAASLAVILIYIASLGQPFSLAESLSILLATASGNTLSAMVALYFCGRVTSLQLSFGDLQWVLKRFLPATAICGGIASIFGIGVYWILDIPWVEHYVTGVANWSVSNMVGALIVTPLLLSYWLKPGWRRTLNKVRWKYPALLSLLLLAFFLFGPGQIWLPPGFLQPALLLIPLLFVALTANQTFTFIFQALTFLLVWVGTTMGYGPFITDNPAVTATAMQLFCGFLAAVILIIQALLCEQRRLRKLWSSELLSNNRKLEQRVQERTQQLSEANRQLEQLSVTDGLTQLANRRRFDEYLQAEWQRASRLQQPLGLIMLDVDWFKNYNDCYGHLQGDEALRQVGKILQLGARRTTDLAARYGGEEFALVVPQADKNYLKQQADMLRMAFASLNIAHQTSPLGRLTVSIGVAVLVPQPHEKMNLLIEKADQALYQAKDDGRNRVVVANDAPLQ
ncbi:MAG: diguanylate cyclase [Gammaproteobacteria bacterium]|nr:diguanylate cyclase [Gammaproteobacteria bacterium]